MKEKNKLEIFKKSILKLSRGTVALLLLSSHLLPSILIANAMESEQDETPVENIEINEEFENEVEENVEKVNDNIEETNTEVPEENTDEKEKVISNESESSANEINPYPQAVTLEGENYLKDGDFEESTPTSSIWRTKNSTAGYELEENRVGYIPNETHDAFLLQVIDTKPGVTYTFSADILAMNVKDGNVAGSLFTTKEVNGSGEQGPVIKEVSLTDTGNEWERVSLEFTAETSKTFVGLVKWADADDEDALNTQTFIDNAVVTSEGEQDDTEKEDEHYELLWEDNFVTEDLDQNYWGYELGNIRGNEQQHYTSSKDNVYIEDGKLVLQVTDRPEEDQYRNTDRLGDEARLVKYNSGSVRTHGKLDFLYGRIEARMRLPKGKGAFPAFWTLGSDFHLDGRISSKHGYGWPQSGEIDIMEMIGAPTEERAAQGEIPGNGTSNSAIHGTAHFYYEHVTDPDGDGAYGYVDSNNNYIGKNIAGGHSLDVDFNDDFHVFGINWSPDKIEWYVDDVVYNTLTFEDPDNPDNQARLNAAKMAFNRPQYIQLNLATGGNWPGDAGDYLGVDDTKVEVDWVRWSQNEDQKQARAAYYENAPQINGVENITVVQGQEMNLLENISTNLEDYTVDFSIENEYMFENSNGRNEVTMLVENSEDVEGLENLESGVYNIHYSAFPTDAQIEGRQYPERSIERKTAVLTVLPEELIGVEGKMLSNIDLPSGMEWENSEQLLGDAEIYNVIFKQLIGSGTSEGNERRVFIKIPDSLISRDTTDDDTSDEGDNETPDKDDDTPGEDNENDDTLGDGNNETPDKDDGDTPDEGDSETSDKDDETPDNGEPSDEDGELPKTGESNLISIVISGLILIVIGGTLAMKAKKE